MRSQTSDASLANRAIARGLYSLAVFPWFPLAALCIIEARRLQCEYGGLGNLTSRTKREAALFRCVPRTSVDGNLENEKLVEEKKHRINKN